MGKKLIRQVPMTKDVKVVMNIKKSVQVFVTFVPTAICVCVDSLTGSESLCHDGVSTHGPVLSPHLEAALTKIKVLPQ